MPKRSKLDPLKDQILEWARQGKDTRWIQAALKERNVEVSHVTVANNIKKWMVPTLNRVNKAAERTLSGIAEAAETIIAWLGKIESEDFENNRDERDRFRLLMEAFDRVAKLRGLYPKEGGDVNVAVITESRASIIASFVDSLPDDLRAKLRDAVQS